MSKILDHISIVNSLDHVSEYKLRDCPLDRWVSYMNSECEIVSFDRVYHIKSSNFKLIGHTSSVITIISSVDLEKVELSNVIGIKNSDESTIKIPELEINIHDSFLSIDEPEEYNFCVFQYRIPKEDKVQYRRFHHNVEIPPNKTLVSTKKGLFIVDEKY